ncbi:MAG: endolytic transglycosylase MltG [Bellilinea sp.]
MANTKRRKFPLTCLLLLLVMCIVAGGAYWAADSIPGMAQKTFGTASPSLSHFQKIQYSTQLLLNREKLLTPVNSGGVAVPFKVEIGESVNSVSLRLEQASLVQSAEAFRLYLIYAGLDTNLQAGNYEISPAWNSLEVAAKLQDATPAVITFTILPGWRVEEIAASLPTTGLDISPGEFLQAVRNPSAQWMAALGISSGSMEGFLFPGEYQLPRETDLSGLIITLIDAFNASVTPELKAGFEQQGLDLQEAVTLASIVQREAMVEDEGPMIASVFYNRLAAGIKLDSDPTVQYAVGYNDVQGTWWTNPLSYADLETDSAYNTYRYAGLPPGPISNPGITALQSVANPASSPYYYFRARCDGTALHNFAVTFEEHLQNSCP